jgi:hypothetical protein
MTNKTNKQLRLVRQDGSVSIRVVLLDDNDEVVHIGSEPFSFSANDIEKLLLMHGEAALCFKKPILTQPTKRGNAGKMEALTFEPEDWEEDE